MSTDQTALYHVTVDGPGMHLERDVAENTLLRILAILLGTASAGLPASSSGGSSGRGGFSPSGDGGAEPNPTESIREFLNRVRARSNPAKIVAIGLHLQYSSQGALFTAADIRSGFVSAGEAAPANLSRDLKLTVQNGWIARDQSSDERWYVTNTGKEVAAAGFEGRISSSSRGANQRKRGSDDTELPAGKRRRAGAGATAGLSQLLDEGYFGTGRTTQDIIQALLERGVNVVDTDLTKPLLTLVQARPQKLKRTKTNRSGSSRPVWEYSAD